jgi:hypothetical protein
MMARLNGSPLTSDEGEWTISLTKPLRSVKEFANEAFRKQPVSIVLIQVAPNRATFTQGNFCGEACSNNISAGGLNELSMNYFPARLVARLQRLQVLAWLESDRFPRRNIDFGTGARIPSYAGLAWLHGENAKPAQLDPVVGLEGIFHAIEDRIHCLFCFRLAYSCPLLDLIHKIEFNHWNLRFRAKAYNNNMLNILLTSGDALSNGN